MNDTIQMEKSKHTVVLGRVLQDYLSAHIYYIEQGCWRTWLAVIIIPPAALKWFTPKGTIGVGPAWSKNQTGIPRAMNALAASLANRSELWRASCPITTPLEAMFGRPWMYLASPCDAWITVKEFIQENPAAIRPRRPAVPNSIPDVQSDV